MNMKSTVLLTLMMPGLLLLSGCNPATPDADTPAVDTAATAPMSDTPPATTMPADTMPADTAMTPDPAMSGAMAGADDNMSFAAMDANSDGSIAQTELAAGAMLNTHFSTADTDSNGMLSEAEVTAHRASMAAAPAN